MINMINHILHIIGGVNVHKGNSLFIGQNYFVAYDIYMKRFCPCKSPYIQIHKIHNSGWRLALQILYLITATINISIRL